MCDDLGLLQQIWWCYRKDFIQDGGPVANSFLNLCLCLRSCRLLKTNRKRKNLLRHILKKGSYSFSTSFYAAKMRPIRLPFQSLLPTGWLNNLFEIINIIYFKRSPDIWEDVAIAPAGSENWLFPLVNSNYRSDERLSRTLSCKTPLRLEIGTDSFLVN